MNLYARLLWILLRSHFDRSLHYSEAVESRFRVWPHDLDAFGHMNNGRYLQIMDVARLHWMVRAGVAGAIRRNRWAPLLGGGFIRYRYSLYLLQPYRVRTQLLCWDEQWFFLEHVFIDKHDRHVAVGISRAGLRAANDWVRTDVVANAVYPGAESPEVPGYVMEWLELEEEMFRRGGEFHHDPSDTSLYGEAA
jgi:acyl-CoA thioesterase FadM